MGYIDKNTGLYVPGSGGGGGGSATGSMEFYKCAAVSGLEDAYLVSGAGTEAVNGNYLKTGEMYSGQDIWKHETANYYMFYDGTRWFIGDNCPPNSYSDLYYIYSSDPTNPYWSYGTGMREPPTVSKTQIKTGEDTWSGYKAVLTDGVYSFEDTLTEGLSYTSVTPKVGGIYSADALIKAYFPQVNSIVDEHTVYAVSGDKGMIELVSGESLTNSGGTVIDGNAFNFAASGAVLDFSITDDAKWHMADFTMEVVCTPCQPSFSYPTVIATGDNWENNAMMLRFGNQYNNSIGHFWTGIGDPVTQGGNIAYSNTEFRHMAICRLGNQITIYDNGTAVATATRDQVWNAASDKIIRLGALDLGSAKYVGKVRWARISNIARYTADFDASDLINGNTPDSPDNGDSVVYKVIDQSNGAFVGADVGEYTEISAAELDALYPLWDGASNSNIKYYTNHANFRLFFNPDTNLCHLQYAYPQGERFQWEAVAITNTEGVNLPATGSWTGGFDVVAYSGGGVSKTYKYTVNGFSGNTEAANGDYYDVNPDSVYSTVSREKGIYYNGTYYLCYVNDAWNGWCLVRNIAADPVSQYDADRPAVATSAETPDKADWAVYGGSMDYKVTAYAGDSGSSTPAKTFDPTQCSVCYADASGMYPTCSICGRAYCFNCIDMGFINVTTTQCDTCYKSVCAECMKTHTH